jgi:hypothetical protein
MEDAPPLHPIHPAGGTDAKRLRDPARNLHTRLRSLALSATVLVAVPTAQVPNSFRYIRAVDFPASAQNQSYPGACFLLDSSVYAHSTPTLSDLRLFGSPNGSSAEIPYAITVSGLATAESEPARILNRTHPAANRLGFDLQMPQRPYSAVALTLGDRDFVASAKLSGISAPSAKQSTYLGTLTLYDLTERNLGRDTTLQFAESTFPYLHIDLEFTPLASPSAPELTAATVPPTRQAQTLYTTVAETQTISQQPGASIATLALPAHVPVERIAIELDPSEASNFSRSVTVSAQAPNIPEETVTGEISRVRLTLAGRDLRHQSLAVPAVLGANARQPASVTVTIQNGTAPPLKIHSIRLEMRQRKLCYPVSASSGVSLVYGDPVLPAPTYPFATTFNPAAPTRPANLSLERLNPRFRPTPPPAPRRLFPAFAWTAVLASLALIAYRRRTPNS